MTKENEEGLEGAPSASENEENNENKENIVIPDSLPQDDPVKKELEKVEKKKFSKRERLNFEKRKIDEQLGKLNEDEGIKPPIDADDDTPVTVGMLKQREKEMSQKTALELSEEIEDEDERKLTQHYLKERIVPSGNASADLKLARAAVNSLKNAQIAEEINRKKNPKNHGGAPGAPAGHEKEFIPTEEEKIFMNPPYNLTKEDITRARQEALAKKE